MNVFKRILFGFSIKDTSKIFPNQVEYVASYHDPRSITWSWCFRWTPPWRLKNIKKHKLSKKLFGYFSFHKQEKMIVD